MTRSWSDFLPPRMGLIDLRTELSPGQLRARASAMEDMAIWLVGLYDNGEDRPIPDSIARNLPGELLHDLRAERAAVTRMTAQEREQAKETCGHDWQATMQRADARKSRDPKADRQRRLEVAKYGY